MLTATRGSVTFVQSVGVAPSTTTMNIPGLGEACAASRVCAPSPQVVYPTSRAMPTLVTAPVPGSIPASVASELPALPATPAVPNKRWYVPYASIEDLRSAQVAGLGIVNESDAWLTGRPYGLPGTTAITLTQRPGGYRSPQGFHYDASLRGAGFGDTDSIALQLQSLVEQQKAQEASLKRIAFWQSLSGGLAIGAVALSATFGVLTYMRRSRR